MTKNLDYFINNSVLDGAIDLFDSLGIKFVNHSHAPLDINNLIGTPTKQTQEALSKVDKTYFVGTIDDSILQGKDSSLSFNDELSRIDDEHYKQMMVFAIEVKQGEEPLRGDIAALTRTLNRMSKAAPVALIVRYGEKISFSICERTAYKQSGHSGEKPGKVVILRDIDIVNTHRGHLDILESLRIGNISRFDDLYAKWLDVFSCDTLTKKFYQELSNWYALATSVIRFPNDIYDENINQKYNHEGAIRLITRLIFVWFMKQRGLIPSQLFDPDFVGERLLKEFLPEEPQGLFKEKGHDSYYYRAILQNLFFATLNCPLTEEGSAELTERKFKDNRGQYSVNSLMRYKELFKDPNLFIELSHKVPFLNGGLFDCLDEKHKGLYFDGFSERKESIQKLCVPDYLFFSDNIQADLSEYYDDKKLKNVTVCGIINIFNRYQFTVEENTPLDQEVALDPELLGKVFENLLASFNSETKTTARKQTGSFYTPREIVQYMVDESLIAHLKKHVGDELEAELRKLLSYEDVSVNLTEEHKKAIMKALYNCRILDPACGSGAFPMGLLQQMVHILKKIDPDNSQWKEMLLDIAIKETSDAYRYSSDEERKELVADIERNFNAQINRPDYARKLYIIENCIYGVDIQEIAIQISKLRFFISLLIDQKTNDNPVDNFGLRPLPNLEAKFVAANSLRSINRSQNLGDTDKVRNLKNELKQLNHKVFIAKTWRKKKDLQEKMAEKRIELAEELSSLQMFSATESSELAAWDMFDQNHHANFFDPEWMFGIKDGFDIIIANPPYVRRTSLPDNDKEYYESEYFSAYKQYDLYLLFIESSIKLLAKNAFLCFINPIKFLVSDYGLKSREFILNNATLKFIVDVSQIEVFDASTYPCIIAISNRIDPNAKFYFDGFSSVNDTHHSSSFTKGRTLSSIREDKYYRIILNDNVQHNDLMCHIEQESDVLSNFFDCQRGVANAHVNFNGTDYIGIKSTNVGHYILNGEFTRVSVSDTKAKLFVPEMVILPRTVKDIKAALKPSNYIVLDRIYYLTPTNNVFDNAYIVGILNSKLLNFWFEYYFASEKVKGGYFDIKGPQIKEIPLISKYPHLQAKIAELVRKFISTNDFSVCPIIDLCVYKIYKLTYDQILIVDPQPPFSREEYESLTIN